MKSRKVNNLFLCTLLAAIALGGCTAGVKKDDAGIVQQRAVERWNLLIAHNAQKAYAYLSPGYRTTLPYERYAQQIAGAQVHWQSVKPIDQKCDEDACTVHLEIVAKVILVQAQGREIETQTPVTEHWVKTDGTWYFLPDSDMKANKTP